MASSARSAPSSVSLCRETEAAGPYPHELVARWDARGEPVLIRPIRPDDAERQRAFFHRLSPEDIRFRFFSVMRELSDKQLKKLTDLDYTRDMALIAVRDATGETVAVARLASDQDEHVAEFAVAVDPAMKGRGLGSELMRRLIAWARTKDVTEIVGQILADNHPMIAFARNLGFKLHRMIDADDVVEARLRLTDPVHEDH